MRPNLNSRQLAAVRHLDGPCLVLAGAGSGKTRVITHKIAYLIQECGIDPRHIAAVTFTNKAAREMKERVSSLLDKSAVQGLRVSTFHTLGLDIIRRELKTLGYKSGFSIYDNTDSAALLRELMTRAFGDHGNQAEQMSRVGKMLLFCRNRPWLKPRVTRSRWPPRGCTKPITIILKPIMPSTSMI